jgi:hypothetical protein
MPRLLRRAGGTLAVVALLLPLTALRVDAQATADSGKGTAARNDTSAAGYGDSSRQAGVDTSRGLPPGGTPTPDSARRAPSDSASPALPQAGIPSDSVLSVTCRSMRAGTLAPGLLIVLFRGSASQKDRTAAVTRAGGAISGEAQGGGVYVRLASDTMSVRTLADQLVLDSTVASVSERSCP